MSNCKYQHDGWGCGTYIMVTFIFGVVFFTSCKIDNMKYQLDRIERAVQTR